MSKGMVRFAYDKPEPPQAKKTIKLAKSAFLDAGIQNVGPEGATNLHSHSGNDGFWFVLAGRARFYDENDNLFAEVGPHEGVLVPHSTPYWFESSDEETLQILHVAACTSAKEDMRVDLPRARASPSVIGLGPATAVPRVRPMW